MNINYNVKSNDIFILNIITIKSNINLIKLINIINLMII